MARTKGQLISPVGILTVTSVNISGFATANKFSGNLEGDINSSGINTLGVTTATNVTLQRLNVSGISTLGVTSATDLTIQQINVSGISTLGVITATNITLQRLNVSGITTLGVTSVTNLDVNGIYRSNIVPVSALEIDCSSGNYFTKTINGNSTFTVANVPSGRAYSFMLELTHTSGSVTWFSGVEWPNATAPTLTTGKTHLFMFITDDGGSRWRAASYTNYTN